MSTKLTSKQRAHLRGLAHPLKPVLHIGKEGVTGDVVEAAVEALRTRELMKVRILENAPGGTRQTAEELALQLVDAHLVQVIGRTAVIYRPDEDDPQIKLPS